MKLELTRQLAPFKKRALAALLAIAATMPVAAARAGHIFSATEPLARPIPLGSPTTPYRAGRIVNLAVPMAKDEVATFTAEAEGSIYSFAKMPDFAVLDYVMFQTSTVLVFTPGAEPPETIPLEAKDHVWRIDVNAIGATQLTPSIGRDIARERDYYFPLTRAGAFKAPEQGIYTFALYMWGGSTEAKAGDIATVYPASAQITVVTP